MIFEQFFFGLLLNPIENWERRYLPIANPMTIISPGSNDNDVCAHLYINTWFTSHFH
jgi:hypothetical protein